MAGRLTVVLPNWHVNGGPRVGVGYGACGTSAVGATAAAGGAGARAAAVAAGAPADLAGGTIVGAGGAPGGVGSGGGAPIGFAVGLPGGAGVGVGSSRQATGVAPDCALGVLAKSTVTRAAFGPHAEAIDAHNARVAQPVLRIVGLF